MSNLQELLPILCCPESRQSLKIADETTLAEIQKNFNSGVLCKKNGQTVIEEAETYLVREDRQLAYPVRSGIPVMLIDEAVILKN